MDDVVELVVDGTTPKQVVAGDVVLLSDSVCTVFALAAVGICPGQFNERHVAGCRKRKTNTCSLDGADDKLHIFPLLEGIDYSTYQLYRLELRMAFKVLGITFTRKLAGLESPNLLNQEVRPYLTRASAIVAEASLKADNLAREKAENSSSDNMIKVIRNVLQ